MIFKRILEAAAPLALIILAFSLSSVSLASQHTDKTDPVIQAYAEHLNYWHPNLNLKVSGGKSWEVYWQLKILEQVLSGELSEDQVEDGALFHLSCPTSICGGGNGGPDCPVQVCYY